MVPRATRNEQTRGWRPPKISSHRSWNIAVVTIDAICTPRLIGVYFRLLDDSSLPPRFVSPSFPFPPTPTPLLFFSSFFIFQLSRRNENVCISSFRNRGSVTRSVLKRIFRKSETKRRRGKCRYFCDIAKGVWRTMAIFRNGLLEKEKKKGKEGEMNGGGWIRLEQCDLDIRSEERCVIRRSWSEILEIVYIRKEKRTFGSFVYIYIYIRLCVSNGPSGGGKRKEKSFHGFSTGRRNVGATTWNSMEDEKVWSRRYFFSIDRSREYKFHFQERERREIWLPVKKFIHPRNRTNIQNERRNILRNTWSKAIESGTNFHQLDPIHRSIFPVQIQLQFFHLHATSSPLSLLYNLTRRPPKFSKSLIEDNETWRNSN